ncbi:MAG: hypothetical protein K6B14_02835 [Lachnospiraceae bacterium]|nr:hypothetical protein [Lachnospiraceae bacterium]
MLKNSTIQKLKYRRGASLLIAMIVFLAASMVSVVIISAALTSLKTVNDDRKKKEEYLAVNSAARLVAECISSSECHLYEKTDRTKVFGIIAYESEYTETDSTGTFGEVLKKMLMEADTVGPPDRKYEISLQKIMNGEDELIPECKIYLRMAPRNTDSEEDNYKITGEVFVGDGSGISQKVYLTAVMGTQPQRSGPYINDDNLVLGSGVETIYYTTTYKWDNINITTKKP